MADKETGLPRHFLKRDGRARGDCVIFGVVIILQDWDGKLEEDIL